MEPTIALMALSFLAAAQSTGLRDEGELRSERVPRAGELELEARILSGLDANSDQRADSGDVAGALTFEAEAAYARRFSERMYGLAELELEMNLRDGEGDASSFGLESELEVSRFFLGRAEAREVDPGGGGVFPRIRVGLEATYALGLSLDSPSGGGAGSNSEGQGDDRDGAFNDRDDGSLAAPIFAFLEPFHEVTAGLHGVYEPRRSTRLEFSPRLVRTLRSSEPGEEGRHSSEVELELEARERLPAGFRVGGAYRLELRRHDERINDDGDALAFQTHETELFVRYRVARFRVRLRHRLRFRNVNEARRSTVRNTTELQLRWRFNEFVDFLGEFATIHEQRLERAERNWSRNIAVFGVAFRY